MDAAHSLATVVVTPRERYSTALRCLPLLLERTKLPHRLVYVAGGAPPHIRTFLQKTCRQPHHELIFTPEFLAPNAARNIGLRSVHTKYAVFVDNDVIVEPGWLEALVRCAEETGSDVVGPLCLFGEPELGLIHTAGGDLRIETRANGLRALHEKHRLANVCLKTTPVELKRAACDYVEFHCMLTRRDLFDRGGMLDEKILSSGEHMDLALIVRELGCKTCTEPTSVVSYLTDAPYETSDANAFHVRWCDDWNSRTLNHFAEKWRLDRTSLFFKDYESFLRRQQEICRLPRSMKAPEVHAGNAGQVFAQTAPQLLNQVQALGYPEWETETIKQALECAVSLFTSIYRESGKSLMNHVVGTASVLAHYGSPTSVVIAGLLHPAYTFGRFGGLQPCTLAAQRRWIKGKVGWRIEELVYEITHIDFPRSYAKVVEGNFDRLPVNTAYLIAMRVANSIDEHLNDELSYHHHPDEVRARNKEQLIRWEPVYRKVMKWLGCEGMLDLLHAMHAKAWTTNVLQNLRASQPGSYEIDPHTGVRVTLPPRSVEQEPSRSSTYPVAHAAMTSLLDRLRNMDLGPEIHRIKLKRIRPHNNGNVRASRNLAHRLVKGSVMRIETDPKQWSYSASVNIHPEAPHEGPMILRMRVHVEHGTVGIGLLRAGSTDEYAVPEQGLEESNQQATVLIPVPELKEAGRLVFRNWSPTSEPSCIRVYSISLHQPPIPQ